MRGKHPLSDEAMLIRADKYVMSHYGCGKKERRVYLDAQRELMQVFLSL